MRKTLFLAIVFTCMAISRLSAQSMGDSYQTAIGVKFWPGALSIKHFTQQNTALEGLINFWDRGFRFTGLYELHQNIEGAPGLRWYVGPGAHIGWYNGTTFHDHFYGNGALSLGIDAVLGLDYKISGAPIAVSIDVQPFFELLEHPYFDVWGGLGIRYTF
jgi:hypothetical protein